MVAKAIALYRGNHRKPPPKAPPRRWVLPRPKITLNDFRRLLLRRSKALSLQSTTAASPNIGPTSAPPLRQDEEQQQATLLDQLNAGGNPNVVLEPSKTNALLDEVLLLMSEDKAQVVQKPALECSNKPDAVEEEQRRREEVEEKLFILNEKKHNIVQALKQILNAEEELKRRSNVQASRPLLPFKLTFPRTLDQ